tara:strand:+ start:974 stop:1168 length:195 start_codon:yes stop_codon:yes gene_type:complete
MKKFKSRKRRKRLADEKYNNIYKDAKERDTQYYIYIRGSKSNSDFMRGYSGIYRAIILSEMNWA